jgi:hypothetical protein
MTHSKNHSNSDIKSNNNYYYVMDNIISPHTTNHLPK